MLKCIRCFSQMRLLRMITVVTILSVAYEYISWNTESYSGKNKQKKQTTSLFLAECQINTLHQLKEKADEYQSNKVVMDDRSSKVGWGKKWAVKQRESGLLSLEAAHNQDGA